MSLVALLGLLAGCITEPLPEAAEGLAAKPAYVLNLGVHYDDVVAMLGRPNLGPRFDRYSNTREVQYRYPTPAIETETRFPDGSLRRELVSTIALYFDFSGVLTRIVAHGNRYYNYISAQPVHRITVMPRLVRQITPATVPSDHR